jgi:protein-tyrosine-phosphatase
MAEGWMKALSGDILDIYSAGTENYPEVKPLATRVMEEVGVDINSHYPKLLSEVPDSVDILITMGCNVQCPYLPTRHTEDWELDDPSGGPIEGFREIRDLIKEKCLDLIERLENNRIF